MAAEQVGSGALPEIDLLDAEIWRRPGSVCAPLFAGGHRAARIVNTGSMMLFRHEDVRTALTDRRLGAMGVRAFEAMGWSEGAFVEWMRRNIVSVDPPAHTRLRGLVNRAFTPRRVEALAGATREVAHALADEMTDAGAGGIDFYGSFAQRLPLTIICRMLAIPDVDHVEMQRWTEAVNTATGIPDANAREAADRAVGEMMSYIDGLIIDRRRSPGDDLLSALVQAEEGGERLTPEELPVMVLQLLVAGHETTRNVIGNGLFCLLTHPEQLAELRADPSLGAGAVEEILRFEPALIWIARAPCEDVEIAGVPLERDKLVMLNLAAANRDPDVHPEPDTFDIRRKDIQILSFGFGAHYCIGANLARLEALVALEVLLERFAKIEFDGDPPDFASYTALRTLESFRVRARAS